MRDYITKKKNSLILAYPNIPGTKYSTAFQGAKLSSHICCRYVEGAQQGLRNLAVRPGMLQQSETHEEVTVPGKGFQLFVVIQRLSQLIQLESSCCNNCCPNQAATGD